MNPAVIPLVAAGGRGDRARLLGMVAGVMVGVALFLLLWGAYQALQLREERTAWLQFGGVDSTYVADLESGPAADAVVARLGTDHVADAAIQRVDVSAPTGDPAGTPQIPGLDGLPPVGAYAASPALAALIASTPRDELGDRFGEQVGILDAGSLPTPDALVVVVGTDRDALVTDPAAIQVASFTGQPYGGSTNYQIVALIGSIALLFPVLLLVSIVTDLGAAQRRDRLSTLRLIGATRGDVARISAVETGVTSLVGALAGVALARLLVPLAAQLRIDGGRFFAADLVASPLTAVVAVAVTVAASMAVAVARVRRSDPGPLGASRPSAETVPRAWRLAPVGLGVTGMVAVTVAEISGVRVPYSAALLIAGFVITSVGLLAAGPYLTWLVTRGAAGRARDASGLIAMSRISRAPRATFRSVGGLVIAVFMVSVFAGAASTAVGQAGLVTDDDHLPPSTLFADLDQTGSDPVGTDPSPGAEEARAGSTPAAIRSAVDPVTRVAGVEHVAVASWSSESMGGLLLTRDDAAGLGLTLPAGDDPFVELGIAAKSDGPAALTAAPAPGALTPAVVIVATDGTTGAVDRARTALDTGPVVLWGHPVTRAENAGSSLRTMVESFAAMANVGMAIATLVAAASLTVATTAGVLDRRRPLGLLRLTGMPVATLRRILLREAAVPLVTVTAGTVGLGFVVAWTILAGLTDGARTVSWPDPSYLVVLAVSVALAVASVVATFPTAERSTGTGSTRFE